MATVCIFSVKIFYRDSNCYYTCGGFGLYLEQMCKNFDWVILVCKTRIGPPPKGYYRIEFPNLDILTVPAGRNELAALAVQPLVFFKGIIAVRRSDVVHARMPDWSGITGNLVARLFDVPRFNQVIDDWKGLANTIPASRKYGLGFGLKLLLHFYDWLERIVLRGEIVFAQGRISYDKHENAWRRYLVLSSAHYDNDIGVVIPKITNSRINVLAVGRLHDVKNHQLLIRALAILRYNDPRWHLRILGEGAKRRELEELAKDLGIKDYVSLPGNVPHDERLWHEYDAADMFVLPSISEGTPKVVLEAMARGCPVIASAVSGVPDAVKHTERGLLFPSGDLDALVSAMRRMANDETLRLSCQHAALAFSSQHTVERSTQFMLEKVSEAYPNLIPLRHG